MPPKKSKRKFFRPRKYCEYCHMDPEKARLQRYFMPVELVEQKPSLTSRQLDKKVLEMPEQEEPFHRFFYRQNSRDHYAYSSEGQSGYENQYQGYDYRQEDDDQIIDAEYDL